MQFRTALFHDVDTPDFPNDALDYCVHPRLCPAWDTPAVPTAAGYDYYQAHIGNPVPTYPLYKLARVHTSSQIVLAMDATPSYAGPGANPLGTAIDQAMVQSGGGYLITAMSGYALTQPINVGPNVDIFDYGSNYPYSWGNMRFRHMNNSEGNFLFCDMHVEGLRLKSRTSSDLKLNNFTVDAPN